MSRSDYTDDLNEACLNVWRGAVASALRGKRGQRLLRELLAALDAMPSKRLISGELVQDDGDVCALGAVGQRLGLPIAGLDPDEYDVVAKTFGVAQAMVREIAWVNDEAHEWTMDAGTWRRVTPEERWTRVRAWVVEQIHP
jgi:hypothetical protein